MKHNPSEYVTCAGCDEIYQTANRNGATRHLMEWRGNSPYCGRCVSRRISPLTLSERTEKRRREQAERQREMDAETRRVMGRQPVAEEGETVKHGPNHIYTVSKKDIRTIEKMVRNQYESAVADAGSPDRSYAVCTITAPCGGHLFTKCRKCHQVFTILSGESKENICDDCIDADLVERSRAEPGERKPYITPDTRQNEIGAYIHPKGEPVARDCDGRKDQ